LRTPAGWCVALLADASTGLRFPRRVLEVAPGRYWLVDMGSWEPNRGRLLEFALPARPSAPPAAIAFSVLADKLDRPLGLVRGPDGKVWIGEAGRISRVAVGAAGAPARLEPVIDGLPASGAHPLKELAFGANGRLYFNVGSATDACRDAAGVQPRAVPRGRRARAARRGLGGDARARRRPSPARHAAVRPGPAQLGRARLRAGRRRAAPGRELDRLRRRGGAARGAQPAARRRPLRLALLHRQPGAGARLRRPLRLQADRSAGAALAGACRAAADARGAGGAGNAFAGQLVVAWHGYRAGGHRVVGQALDARGRPQGEPTVWIDGWTAQAGVRPLGAPTGLASMRPGAC
jgi:glucose/arabinose dehydrogenase